MTENITRRETLRTTAATLAASATLPIIGQTAASTQADDLSGENWPQFGRDPGNTGHNPDAQDPRPGAGETLVERWSFSPDDERLTSAPVAADGDIFVTAETQVFARATTSGEERWTYEADQRVYGPPVALLSGSISDEVYVGTEGGDALGLTIAVGGEGSRYSIGEGLVWQQAPLTAAGTTLYTATASAMQAIDTASDSVLWSFSGVVPSAAPAVGEDVWFPSSTGLSVVVPDERVEEFEGTNWKLNPLRVTELDGGWTAITWPDVRWNSQPSPAIAEGTVYSPGLGLQALDIASGSEKWWYSEEPIFTTTSPAYADGTVYAGSGTGIEDSAAEPEAVENAGMLYAFDAQDGSVSWQFETDGPINSAPVVGVRTVFVASDDGHLYAVNITNGDEVWRYQVVEAPNNDASMLDPILVDDLLIVGSETGGLIALTAASETDDQNGNGNDDEGNSSGGTDDGGNSSGGTGGEGDTGEEEDDGTEGSDDGSGPGFGFPAALGALGGAGYLLRRRTGDDQ